MMTEQKVQQQLTKIYEACEAEVEIGEVGTSGPELLLIQVIKVLKEANPDASDSVFHYWLTEALA
jgi:hypothetical protein